jgi:hypothetical protein
MSTSHNIIFFSKEITPTMKKIIEFGRKEPFPRIDKKYDVEYYSGGIWVHEKGVGFDYFGIDENKKHKGLKCFFHIGNSNIVYETGDGRRLYYNYPFFSRLMEHIKNDNLDGIYIMCVRNEDKQRPKWIKEWKGKLI